MFGLPVQEHGELVKGAGFRILDSHFQKVPYCKVPKSSRRSGVGKGSSSNSGWLVLDT
jgi:hypothetical protein